MFRLVWFVFPLVCVVCRSNERVMVWYSRRLPEWYG